MSRSYKKNPVVKDHTKNMKSIANRIFRHKNIRVANGNAYRKVVCSYDISDWKFRETYAEYCIRAERYKFENSGAILTLKAYNAEMSYWQWFKMYRRK